MGMSFDSYLEEMRAKPEHIRRRMAFGVSLAITAVIFVFWLGSMTSLGASSTGAIASAVEKAGSPGKTLVASIGSFVTDIKDIIFGPKKVIYSSIEVRPGTK